MDATVRFYVGVLGARLIATIGTPDFRHYFFEIGTGNSVAFFEYQGVAVEPFAKPAGVPHPRAAQFDHLSLDLVDEEALLELRDRLKRADCEVTDVVDHGFIHSIYFTDPNGIALEASWWIARPDRSRPSCRSTTSASSPTPTPSPAVNWIIEVVVERLDIKQQIFTEVEKYRQPGTLITSNTSGIPIHMMAEGRSDDFKKHFCGTHFFNPPRYLRLLEIIPTPFTDPAVIDFLMHYGDLYLGKTTVLCKDTPAFIANRVGVYGIMEFWIDGKIGINHR